MTVEPPSVVYPLVQLLQDKLHRTFETVILLLLEQLCLNHALRKNTEGRKGEAKYYQKRI